MFVEILPTVDDWLEHLAANAKVATAFGSIPASTNTVESDAQQIK